MKITQIKIQNFKALKGENTFDLSSGLVFLVGENNTGKTTLLEAISFLKSGLPEKRKIEDFKNKQASDTDFVSVQIKIQGNITSVIDDFSEEKYKKYVYKENEIETVLICRSSEQRTVKQGTKDVELNEKKITLWNSETNNFENASGLDTVIGTLFESQFVWSDTNPDDVTDFGSTKICGKLLNNVVGDFYQTDKWKSFVKSHKATFHEGDDSLSKKSEALEQEIQKVLAEQYGDAKIKFDFNLPEAKAFFTSTTIKVDDGVETDLKDKGSGMQRAFALAIIQTYAKFLTKHETDESKQKPLFFFIDEPEISLHPKAQKILMGALKEISKNQQIFLTTHSPYVLKEFSNSEHNMFIFTKDEHGISYKPSNDFKLFSYSPTWGEINYFAYDLPTIEFHDELYGFLHERYISNSSDQNDADNRGKQTYFEKNYLQTKLTSTKKWTPEFGGVAKNEEDVTLATFIRNKVHHPENKTMQSFCFIDADLKSSIDGLLNLVSNP